ncbi:spore germination protein [Clostridium thailandense]|uniref:spore germination protein n=1 Tax=Clostridium thailandense TaxID=2794346 RepID=UPI003989305A
MLNQSPLNLENMEIMLSIDENLLFLKNLFGNSIGLNESKFKILGGNIETGIAYIESICNKELVRRHVMDPLQNRTINCNLPVNDIAEDIQAFYISSANIRKTNRMKELVDAILRGNTLVFFDNSKNALIIESRDVEKRSISAPENEATILSSRESFTEDIETNISMIIKRIPIPNLQFETFVVGKLSRTTLKLIWIKDIANSKLLNEVETRLRNIDIDMVEGTGVLAELIKDKAKGIFPTYQQTERPDMAAKRLSQGHFCIVCNNSPFAIICPITFWDNFKTMDDYAESPAASSLLRIIRFIAFVIAVIISPLYLSAVTYNHTVVPPSLALNISIGREGVPFPTIIELIGMTIIIDIIREAGIRMPGMIGYFIGTLGAVIIGQAAVTAGYVSASLIIVVAFSAIASFAISTTIIVNPSRIINYFLILLSGFFGMFGFLNGIFIILWSMATTESFGVPYLYPIVPIELGTWNDIFFRGPYNKLKKRLNLVAPANNNRIGNK